MSATSTPSVYDPLAVNLYIGPMETDGFADNSFITAKKNSPVNNLKVGAQGDVTILKQNDMTGLVTIRLKQNSRMHTFLATSANVDQLTPGGIPVFPIMCVQDAIPVFTGTAKIGHSTKREFPGGTDGKDEPVCEWELICPLLLTTS